MCQVFIQDWFTQPISPKDHIYQKIHHKRLLRVLPTIAPIFIRLIKSFTYYDITGVFFAMEGILLNAHADILFEPKDVVEKKLLAISWICMANHYIGKMPDEIRFIEDILKDACVCKEGETELIGYYLKNMIMNLKDVHSSHVKPTDKPYD